MPLTTYVNRLKLMEDLIRRRATGTPEEFAKKMNLSRSATMLYLKEMRKMGACIIYCQSRQSYFFEEPVKFHFGFKPISMDDMKNREARGNFTFLSDPKILDSQLSFLPNV